MCCKKHGQVIRVQEENDEANGYSAPGSLAYTAETNGLSPKAIADKIMEELI